MVGKKVLEKIRKIRKEKKISSDKLGEMVGLSGAAIRHIENGRRRLNMDLLEKIANALGVSVVELLEVEEIQDIRVDKDTESDEILIRKLIDKRIEDKKVDKRIYTLAEKRLKRALEDIDDLFKLV